ncbi:M56 family metallopeptidase [uncultured Bacteroides sp.]|uniref:M56 family metallopeptidase n=1 Tax=uncultured Bacteroides sp. TaxID=162156 RepID=UPI0025E0F549|nr:M56 family metallopeptidase [uncultured Bacteroides sp.]
MGLFFVYILKSSVCLAAFYLFYRLLLSRETFHRFNRFALLGILLLSCLLPLIEVSVQQETGVHQTMMSLEQWLLLAEAMNSVGVQAQETTVTWIQVALLLYLMGILFFAFRNMYSLLRLLVLLKSGRRGQLGNYVADKKGVTLIVHNKEIAPFSWMRYIVISQKDLDENGREILIHELAHIHNRHSLDLLVADICIFFQWFNPASWLLKQELQNIHEYEADETVIKEGVDAKQYQLLLIKKAVGTRLYSMANSFNHSKLKKRITMMLKEKSSPWARMKYLYVLPLAAIAVTAFARPEISSTAQEISAVKVNDLAAIVETKVAESMGNVLQAPVVKVLPKDTTKTVKVSTSTVFDVVEHMPEYPGGMAALMQYFRDNLRYPESAHKAGKQGRVSVQFIIDKDGSIKAPKVVHSVDKDLDAESIRLVKSLPNWKPGMQKGQPVAVRYTVPIMFRLNENDGSLIRVSSREEPLYIINGKETDAEIMRALDPQNIESVEVLKDESAVSRFGEKGKNGVILITLKNRTSSAITVTGVKAVNKTTDIPGVGGVYMSNKKVDMKDVNLYVDGELVKLEGKQIEDYVPANQIESISVNKAKDGKGDIYIVTKKNAKGQEKTASQGNMKVMGAVKDEKGEPIIAATVLIEGTTTGTISDADGNFVLSVPNKDAVLIVSYINMKTAKVKASPQMTVVLKEE